MVTSHNGILGPLLAGPTLISWTCPHPYPCPSDFFMAADELILLVSLRADPNLSSFIPQYSWTVGKNSKGHRGASALVLAFSMLTSNHIAWI